MKNECRAHAIGSKVKKEMSKIYNESIISVAIVRVDCSIGKYELFVVLLLPTKHNVTF